MGLLVTSNTCAIRTLGEKENTFFLEFSEEKTSTESRDGNIKSE